MSDALLSMMDISSLLYLFDVLLMLSIRSSVSVCHFHTLSCVFCIFCLCYVCLVYGVGFANMFFSCSVCMFLCCMFLFLMFYLVLYSFFVFLLIFVFSCYLGSICLRASEWVSERIAVCMCVLCLCWWDVIHVSIWYHACSFYCFSISSFFLFCSVVFCSVLFLFLFYFCFCSLSSHAARR